MSWLKILLMMVALTSASVAKAEPDATPDPAAAPKETAEPSAPHEVLAATEKFPDLIFNQSPADSAAMDIPPDTYKDFWKKWHFVTVRWREDSREFRFAYANDLAWKTLSEHRTDYPVGAMFGKLAYQSEEDMALPSSVLAANRLARLEVMMWDPKNKKAGANGWVYLRFLTRDPSMAQDKDSTGVWGVMSDKEIKSCVECHNRAYDRGYVFSQPLYLFREPGSDDKEPAKVLSNRFADSMKVMQPNDVPRIASNLIHSLPGWEKRPLKGYQGDFFAGSLAEIRPVMSRLATAEPGTVFMIYDRDDPNTIQLASTIEKKDYKSCVGFITMRGSGIDPFQNGPEVRRVDRTALQNISNSVTESTHAEAQGVQVLDVVKVNKPFATFYTECENKDVNKQTLPLLFTTQDKDGLPSYYFAPAKLD